MHWAGAEVYEGFSLLDYLEEEDGGVPTKMLVWPENHKVVRAFLDLGPEYWVYSPGSGYALGLSPQAVKVVCEVWCANFDKVFFDDLMFLGRVAANELARKVVSNRSAQIGS